MNKKSNGQTMSREEGSRRSSLLSAAARLFREKGFEATTVRDIAGAVGMGSGSPFCHFRSKQHILGCIVQEGMAAALASVETLMAQHLSPAERFRSLMRLHISTLHHPDNDFVAVMLYEWRALSADNRQQLVVLMDRYESAWHECLYGLQQAGQLHGNLPLIRQMILGATNWSLRWFKPDGPLSTDELGEAVANLFLGLGTPPLATTARRNTRQRRPASADFGDRSSSQPA